MTLLWWNDALSILVGGFFLGLTGTVLYYRNREAKRSMLRSFRTLTAVLTTVTGLYYLTLGFADAPHLPRIIRAGLFTKGLLLVWGFWLIAQLWLSHGIMRTIEGDRNGR